MSLKRMYYAILFMFIVVCFWINPQIGNAIVTYSFEIIFEITRKISTYYLNRIDEVTWNRSY